MKSYVSKSKIVGPCGPCSFINLTGIRGGAKKEKELSESGRLKPFRGSQYQAFLVWADKHGFNLNVYTTSKKLNNKVFELMFNYEKIPEELKSKYKNQAKNLMERRNKKYREKINLITSPLKKLNELLQKGSKVAVLTSDFYLGRKRDPVPHWIVAYKKEGNKYYFMDSARKKGRTVLTTSQIKKGWEINKKQGFSSQLVSGV